MSKNSNHRQLVVLGAGPGGYAAAFVAADLGMDVTLIDKEKNPGGVCLHRGCIPAKALLHVTQLIMEAQRAADWGVRFEPPEVDLDKLRDWKNSVIGKLTQGLGQLCKQRRIDYIQGTARFLGDHRLQVDRVGGATEEIQFEQAIIATGSVTTKLPHLPDDSERIMYSEQSLEIESIPKTMLVIGGGYIGLEQADTYARLGTRVTVVDMMPQLMPGTDGDLVNVLHKELEQRFEDIVLETRVTDVAVEKNGLRVRLEGKGSEPTEQRFDKLLVAVGRTPNTAGLGLDATNVRTDERGFIRTDDQCRTDDPSIFAVGDVASEPLLAHKATHEGKVAATVAAGKEAVYEPRAVPFVEYTHPEIAACGLSESKARESGIPFEVATFPWQASGRAATLGESRGFTKLIIDPDSQRILGVAIVGANAGELIAEGVLAVEMAALAGDLAWTIHPHPSLSETLMEAAGIAIGEGIHYRGKKGRGKPG